VADAVQQLQAWRQDENASAQHLVEAVVFSASQLHCTSWIPPSVGAHAADGQDKLQSHVLLLACCCSDSTAGM
jgi:hypothetical protein